MPKHNQSKTLPYTADQMFELVSDVDHYPHFLPWCIGARVFQRREGELKADLIIGFQMYKERFTSHVLLERPGHIHVNYIRGPLKYLHNDWRFTPDGNGCRVDFVVDFEFRARPFEKLVGRVFTEAVHRMVNSFETEAARRYDEAVGKGAPSY